MHSHELYHHRTNICIKTSLLPASTCIFNSCCACLQSMISPRNNRCFPEIPISKIVVVFFPLPIKPRRQRGPRAGTEGCCHTALSWDKGQACSHVCALYPTFQHTHRWNQKKLMTFRWLNQGSCSSSTHVQDYSYSVLQTIQWSLGEQSFCHVSGASHISDTYGCLAPEPNPYPKCYISGNHDTPDRQELAPEQAHLKGVLNHMS